eukprot:3794635-Ditylum_brightwellii.AAC.1
MTALLDKREEKAKEEGTRDCSSKVIINNVLLYGGNVDELLPYFKVVLSVLQYHRAMGATNLLPPEISPSINYRSQTDEMACK